MKRASTEFYFLWTWHRKSVPDDRKTRYFRKSGHGLPDEWTLEVTTVLVTGSAVALHCCKAYERINRKTGNSTPCKIVTPENFSSKVCTRDYVVDGNYCANFYENRFSAGFSPNRWNITPLWLFWLSCPVLFSRSCAQPPRSNRWTDFHALWLKRRVSAQGNAFWGLQR